MQLRFITWSLFLLLLLPGRDATAQTGSRLLVGAERMELITPLLQGKRVALALNQTSILPRSGVHLLDTLLGAGVQVEMLFAPEHGVRGEADAGEQIANSADAKTGIPIFSLYGKEKKPSAALLSKVDLILFDIQDVGARFYTYISTMHYLMEACAEAGKTLIVLDRPNPNDTIDGPIREEAFRSFVGVDPLPLLHGLTVGELAQMINGEGWLASTPGRCSLIVIPMAHWQHGDPYSLPVRPSPNLPNDQSIRLYPSLCLFEGTCISVGRGTRFPFQLLGHPDKIMGEPLFTPVPIKGMERHPMHQDKLCYGIDLRKSRSAGGFTLRYVIDFHQRAQAVGIDIFTQPTFFDRLAGTASLRQQIIAGASEETIRKGWQEELKRYIKRRKQYLIYDDKRSFME